MAEVSLTFFYFSVFRFLANFVILHSPQFISHIEHMKKKFIYIICILISCLVAFGSSEADAAKKRSKARTTSVKKKSTGKKRSTASKSTGTKKTTTTKKRSSKKSKARKKSTGRKRPTTSFKPYTPPVEPQLNDSLTLMVNDSVIAWIPAELNPGGLRVNSVIPDNRSRTAKVGLNENFTYLPVTSELINNMRRRIESVLPDSISDFRVMLNVGPRAYSYYITTIDKLPEQYRRNVPFVTDIHPYASAKKGMNGDIIALWPSHGRYYKPETGAWLWQRPQLFECTEDTHTMSYILPFVTPMLENAGAYVMLPRERDTNSNEVIVDNDVNDSGQIYSQPYYKEMTGQTGWKTGEEEGFIYDLPDFRDTENPFENGTYRQTSTIAGGRPSVAAWYADIPEDGEYAVYVSYKSLPNSTEDARYTVNYSGGTREFKVNQTMGGSTWIYLGTFPFEAGYSDTEPVVTLSNLSATAGKILTADAVKIGGGIGNIARSPRRSDIYSDPSTPVSSEEEDVQEDSDDEPIADDDSSDETNDEADVSLSETTPAEVKNSSSQLFRTSGLPRYLEGARYWLQWAGMPEDVYSPYHGSDDYKDDYTSRALWVNYLAGGSRVLPGSDGLGIPVDAAFALHSDAGKRDNDTFVGTLGIYYTNGGESYTDGTPRSNSRTLTDMLMRQITGDIRQTWEPDWTRRSMWDKSYVEARIPEVPTSLIELLSHQNFADMRYALDPYFRFTVSRSIYKALGRFVSERKDRKFVVQPLPVKDFYIRKEKQGHYLLSWSPTPDRLEPTAVPNRYLVFERTADELGFHLLGETTSTHFEVIVEDNDIHSFRIEAVNDGGRSFPSETLALRESSAGTKPVLIINGFTRVSGPENFNSGSEAGFRSDIDFGVPYIKDILYIGQQTEFRRGAGEAFGRSEGSKAAQIIAGNTFDYPYMHGLSIAASGRGFVSSSVGAVMSGHVSLSNYNTVDLILGKQKSTVTGNGNTGIRFSAFPEKLQEELRQFTHHGGDLLVSGAYISSELADSRAPEGSAGFAEKILGIIPERYGVRKGATQSPSLSVGHTGGIPAMTTDFCNTLNEKMYIVQNPEALLPYGNNSSETFVTFGESGLPAGIMTRNGKSRVAVLSVPFETIGTQDDRNVLMKGILDFFDKK